jgi:hypothetical protein
VGWARASTATKTVTSPALMPSCPLLSEPTVYLLVGSHVVHINKRVRKCTCGLRANISESQVTKSSREQSLHPTSE